MAFSSTPRIRRSGSAHSTNFLCRDAPQTIPCSLEKSRTRCSAARRAVGSRHPCHCNLLSRLVCQDDALMILTLAIYSVFFRGTGRPKAMGTQIYIPCTIVQRKARSTTPPGSRSFQLLGFELIIRVSCKRNAVHGCIRKKPSSRECAHLFPDYIYNTRRVKDFHLKVLSLSS